jgi:hypothetical protein
MRQARAALARVAYAGADGNAGSAAATPEPADDCLALIRDIARVHAGILGFNILGRDAEPTAAAEPSVAGRRDLADCASTVAAIIDRLAEAKQSLLYDFEDEMPEPDAARRALTELRPALLALAALVAELDAVERGNGP